MENKRAWINIALLLIVAGVLMFSYLGTSPLMDPDEPVYAETALEMLQFNDFISPRIYGDFWFDKPPMYYWLVAGAFKIFGVGEFSARFPSALMALGGAVLVYLSGRKLFGERAGLISALVLATSLEYFYLGNAAVTDMTLTFFLTAALLAFLHRNYYLLYGFAGLAVVTKGPVAIFFCGVIIGLFLILTGKLGTIKRMKLISGVSLFAIIALPWYIAMYHFHGMAFIDTFLGFHNVTRFLQPEHPSGRLWFYYIPVLILGFFPWTAFLGQAFISGLKEKGESRSSCIFLLIWALVVFGFFSVSQTKLVSYILPMYPPLALLTGRYFDKIWTEQRYSALKWPAVIFSVIVVILLTALAYTGSVVTIALLQPVKMVIGMYIVLASVIILQSFRGNFYKVFVTHIVGMMLFLSFLMTQMLPVVAPAVSVKDFVAVFNQYYDGQAPIYVAKFYRPGFMFYSGMPGIEIKPEEITSTIDKNEKSYFIMQKANFKNLPQEIKDKIQILSEQEDKILLVRTDD